MTHDPALLKTYTRCLKWLSPPQRALMAELQAPATSDCLISDTHPHFNRALSLSATRLLHLCRSVASAYSEQFQRKYGRFHPGLSRDNKTALKSKHLPLFTNIYCICAEHNIPLRHWFRAQFDVLSKMPCVYVTACSGPNALKRYEDWKSNQSTRFINHGDRKAALDRSIYRIIEASILDSHLVALKHWERIRLFEPPTLGAGILTLYPQVSAWYLVSHPSVRAILAAGLWSDPVVMDRLKQYNSVARIRSSCQMGLDAAIENHGTLEL